MGLEVRVSSDLLAVQRAMKQAANRGLGKEMGKALRAASKPFAPAIRAEAAQVMPSGYAPVLSKSLRFRTAVKETRWSAHVSYRVHGQGRKERRDVPALNRGRLKHPHWGNRNIWHTQQIRPGFVDRPVDRLRPNVGREMDGVVSRFAAQITRG